LTFFDGYFTGRLCTAKSARSTDIMLNADGETLVGLIIQMCESLIQEKRDIVLLRLLNLCITHKFLRNPLAGDAMLFV